MKILAIESSCDETGAAVVEKNGRQIKVLSNVLATSSEMHALSGGIIPENAAREQVKAIIPVIIRALLDSNLAIEQYNNLDTKQRKNLVSSEEGFRISQEILKTHIDAIAVTYGPGLIGSLLIGVETAKSLSFAVNKPIIPVNHLLAHIYANFISTEHQSPITNHFPFIGLIVSGGHTDLLYFKAHDDYKWLGGTRDDAAGEAIDKIGRMLGLSYPAGPEMEKRAKLIERPEIKFQSPLINSNDYDFSFSGLKAEVMRFVKKNVILNEVKDPSEIPDQAWNNRENLINQICYATQKAIFDVIVKKTIKAAEENNCSTILIGGGVSANLTLMERFRENTDIKTYSPELRYATDNAAMIGAYALVNGKEIPWQEVKSTPELYFS